MLEESCYKALPHLVQAQEAPSALVKGLSDCAICKDCCLLVPGHSLPFVPEKHGHSHLLTFSSLQWCPETDGCLYAFFFTSTPAPPSVGLNAHEPVLSWTCICCTQLLTTATQQLTIPSSVGHYLQQHGADQSYGFLLLPSVRTERHAAYFVILGKGPNPKSQIQFRLSVDHFGTIHPDVEKYEGDRCTLDAACVSVLGSCGLSHRQSSVVGYREESPSLAGFAEF